MGIFSFLKRSSPKTTLPVRREIPVTATPIVSPQELRRQLFDAAASGDSDKLTCLCKLHEKNIFDQGLLWTKVPETIRGNPSLLRWYGNGLKAIAGFCAEQLQKPELMDRVEAMQHQADTELSEDEVKTARDRLDIGAQVKAESDADSQPQPEPRQ